MNDLIVDRTELGFVPDAVEVLGVVGADLNSTLILETIRVREVTQTPLLEVIIQFRPSSHWGINE